MDKATLKSAEDEIRRAIVHLHWNREDDARELIKSARDILQQQVDGEGE